MIAINCQTNATLLLPIYKKYPFIKQYAIVVTMSTSLVKKAQKRNTLIRTL